MDSRHTWNVVIVLWDERICNISLQRTNNCRLLILPCDVEHFPPSWWQLTIITDYPRRWLLCTLCQIVLLLAQVKTTVPWMALLCRTPRTRVRQQQPTLSVDLQDQGWLPLHTWDHGGLRLGVSLLCCLSDSSCRQSVWCITTHWTTDAVTSWSGPYPTGVSECLLHSSTWEAVRGSLVL